VGGATTPLELDYGEVGLSRGKRGASSRTPTWLVRRAL